MHSQSPHPDMTLVVWNVWSLANRQNQQKHRPLGNSQLPPAKRRVSIHAGERDSSQAGSSVASAIKGQNSTPSFLLNNSRIADINHCVTSTPSATQRRSINTPTTTPGTSCHTTPAPRGTSTCRVISSPASGIAITPTPLSGLENLPTPPSLIEKPMRSLQIHSERELPKRIRERGSGNCNRTGCLHLDQWSPAVAASIDLVTPSWRVLSFQRADSWSSTCWTDGHWWVQVTCRQSVMQHDAFRKY